VVEVAPGLSLPHRYSLGVPAVQGRARGTADTRPGRFFCDDSHLKISWDFMPANSGYVRFFQF
jgi:hypothetical protein